MEEAATSRQTLKKTERLHLKSQIDRLFGGGHSRSFTSFPLRVVLQEIPFDETTPHAQILVSVPKRHLKHAVDRNRVKRQVREAYRKNKQSLLALLAAERKALAIAFIWMDRHMHSSAEIETIVVQLLSHIAENIQSR